ncbi:hypothetical protein NDU88_004602 [Pleurodeles waltl]|uniref:Uncharacterized protein n=1 Tax=Pleurodeles waltl TaxID=8319 RepID=A0AAV7RIL5_PLEWA|nr:hypothetical protein NDU88_004602 [Pleurodeles waltl]
MQSLPEDGGMRSQEEELRPGDGEPLAQGGESQLDNSQTRSSERNCSQKTEIRKRRETEEGEDTLEPATF